MAKISNIVIHCSDSAFGNANEIRRWHKEKGWNDIGYHFVILNGMIFKDTIFHSLDGSIECGRPVDGNMFLTGNEIGAHALGYNNNSIGICLIGKNEFTKNQMIALRMLVKELVFKYDIDIYGVMGHNETESGRAQGKTCPNFDVETLREDLLNGDK